MSDRNELGRQMATKLYAAERALDVALAEIGDLSALMTRGRIDHGIAAIVGQEALEHVSKCGGALTKARRALVEGHKQMARDAKAMRIAWASNFTGPGETKPDDGPRLEPVGRFRQAA